MRNHVLDHVLPDDFNVYVVVIQKMPFTAAVNSG